MKRKRRFWLRWCVWSVTGLLAVLVGLYAYFTHPSRLRAQVLRILEAVPGVQVTLGDVAFSPWSGLELADLELRAALGGSGGSAEETDRHSCLRIGHARLTCQLAAILAGRLRLGEIHLQAVEAQLVCRADGATPGAALHLEGEESISRWARNWPVTPPQLRIERADLQVWLVQPEGERLLRRDLVSATGEPTGDSYEIKLESPAADRGRLAVLRWNHQRSELAAETDYVNLAVATPFMPAALRNGCRELGLRGEVRAEQVVLVRIAGPPETTGGASPAPGGFRLRQIALRGRQLRATFPVEEAPPGVPAAGARERFLSLTDADVAVDAGGLDQVDGGHISVQGAGKLNDAPAEFRLVARVNSRERAAFRVEDLDAFECRVRGLSLPTADSHPAFVRSRRLPGPVRAVFKDYHPSGRVNVAVYGTRAVPAQGQAAGTAEGSVGGDRPLEWHGEAELLHARGRCERFPYDFSDVCGRVRFSDEGVRLEGLTARHGSAVVRGEGLVYSTRPNAGFELRFRGMNVPLDADLYAALPENYQRLWQSAAPVGLCDVDVDLRRPDGPPVGEALPTEADIQARLLAGSLLIEPGRRLQAADGALSIAHGVMTIHDLHGYLDGAAVRVAGHLRGDRQPPSTNVTIEAADVSVERGARIPLHRAGSTEFRFLGRADVWGHLRQDAPDAAREADYVARIKDGHLQSLDPGRQWEQCEGWIRAVDGRQEVLALAARQAQARLLVGGQLENEGVEAPLALDARIADVAIEQLPSQVVPERWRRAADALGLSGRGEVYARFRPQTGDDGTSRQTLDLRLSAARMRPSALPLDFDAAELHGRIREDEIEITSATAAYGSQGRVQGSGRWEWSEGDARGEFRLLAADVDLTAEVIEALPAPAARALRKLDPRGRAQVVFDRVLVVGRDRRSWEFVGRIGLESGELQLGLPLGGLRGQLEGRASVSAAGALDLAARLSVAEGLLAGRPIHGWEGRVRKQPDDRWVRLEGLHGRLGGGDALAAVNLDPETSEYELSLTLQNVRLAELLPARPSEGGRERRGTVAGNMYLRGQAGRPESRAGGGYVRLSGASFLHTPILSQVAEVRRRENRPTNDALDAVDVRFAWQGARLEMTRMDVQGRNLRLVGYGSWNIDSDALDLTLVGAHPKDWPRIAVVTDVLEAAGQELVQYRVRGTTAAPQVTAEPLYRLSETLRALVAGGP